MKLYGTGGIIYYPIKSNEGMYGATQRFRRGIGDFKFPSAVDFRLIVGSPSCEDPAYLFCQSVFRGSVFLKFSRKNSVRVQRYAVISNGNVGIYWKKTGEGSDAEPSEDGTETDEVNGSWIWSSTQGSTS